MVHSSSFKVRISMNLLTITNIYIPPNRRAEEEVLVLTQIPITQDSMVFGDINSHLELWDPFQPQDSRENRIEEWLSDTNLQCANTGLATRTNKATGGQSSPDVALVPPRWMDRVAWSVKEDIGGSDYLPCLTTISCEVQTVKQEKESARWNYNKANCKAFSEAVETELAVASSSTVIFNRVKRFNETLIEAVEHVGRAKPAKKKKPWMTREIRALVKKRTTLRRQISLVDSSG